MTDFNDNSDVRGLVSLPDFGRRAFLGATAAIGAAAMTGLSITPGRAAGKDPKDYHFGVAIPYSGQESYEHIIAGYKGAMDALGGSLTIVDSNWDVKKQADQIATLVSSGVDALIVLPIDPSGISNAVQAAVAKGVPTFCTDNYVLGTNTVLTSVHNHFGMGEVSARRLAEKLGGKGKIGILTLSHNECWAMRSMGMRFALRQYPDIEIVVEWPFDTTLKVTPRDAVDNMLTAHPDLNGIWAAWDQAAIEATLAVMAAQRNDMFVTGIDGGKQAFEYIQSGTPFFFTVAQSFYQEAYQSIYFAHEFLAGRQSPRLVVNKAYGVTQENLANREGGDIENWDQFGVADKLGWAMVA
jgi:ribose transport system substrate-binding protein